LAGKEGSLFEEDYLVDSLCKLIIQWRSIRGTIMYNFFMNYFMVFYISDDLPELIQAMLSHSLFRQAAELQQLAGKVESNIRENVKEIFRPAPPQLHQLPTALRLQLTSIINEGLEPGALNPFPILFKTPVEPELLSKQWQSSLI
jgi:hypothetical protein